MARDKDSTRDTLLAIIAVCLAGCALFATRPVVVPVLFAVFLAILVQPMVARLNRGLPYWLSLVIVLLALTVMLASVGVALVTNVANVYAELGKYSAKIERLFARAAEIARGLGLDLERPEFGVQENMSRALSFVRSGLTSVFSILAQASVVVVLAIFALIEGHNFTQKIMTAFGPERGREALDVLEPIGQSIQQYLRTKTLVSLVTGGVAYLICLAIGIDFAFAWGALVFLFNFLPYFGPVLAALLPIAVAFLQYDSPTRGIIAVFTLGLSQWLSGSIIEPQIMGRSLKVSVLFLLVSMLFWGWFWGLAGVVLAIPLSSVVAISCAHIDRLKPIASLLGAKLPNHEAGSGGGAPQRQKAEKAPRKSARKSGKRAAKKS